MVAHAYLGSNPAAHYAAENSTAAAAAAFADAGVVGYIPNTDLGVVGALTAAAVGIEGAAAAAGGHDGELAGVDEGAALEAEEGMMMKLLLKSRER